MRCLTNQESKEWAKGHGHSVKPRKAASKVFCVSGEIPKDFSRLTWFSNFLATSFVSFDQCLLWITEWGIWPSSENPHLFYRLRQTYGENRLLNEAPGHLFLKHEVPDLASFISVGIISGWGFHLQPSPYWVRGFVSHDKWFNLEAENESNLAEIKRNLKDGEVAFKTSPK